MTINDAVALFKSKGWDVRDVWMCYHDAFNELSEEKRVALANDFLKSQGNDDLIMTRSEFDEYANSQDFLILYDRIIHSDFDPACDWFQYDDTQRGFISYDGIGLDDCDAVITYLEETYKSGAIADTDFADEFNAQINSYLDDMNFSA